MRIDKSVIWRNDWMPYHPYGELSEVRKSYYPNIDWFDCNIHFFTRTGLCRFGLHFMLFGIGVQAYIVLLYE